MTNRSAERALIRITKADDGHEAAGGGAFLAVAEKKIAAAGGAEIAHENIFCAHSGIEELRAIRFFQIEQNVFGWRLVAGRHPAEPLKRIRLVAGAEFIEPIGGIRKLRFEFDDHFHTHFVTAAANRGTNRSEQIRRLGAELHLHFADGLGDDALQRAAPARMNSGDCTLPWVDEKDRNAIRGLHGEKKAHAVCDGSVAAARFARRGVECVNDVGVKLFERGEREIVCAERGLEAAAIFQNVFAGIPVGEAEIQNFSALQVADATWPSAETVDQPGKLREGWDLEDANAADRALTTAVGAKVGAAVFARSTLGL